MRAQTKLKIIKMVCWLGVAADALWTVALVHPGLYGTLIGMPDLQLGLFTRLTMGVGASLMSGWTVLLVWTTGNPIERRAVLLFTAVPVIAGLITVTTISFLNGNTANIWIMGKCVVLMAAMLTGFFLAGTIVRESADEIEY